MPKPNPLGHDEEGRPIWARNDKGEPICGYKAPPNKHFPQGRICTRKNRGPNGRCHLKRHGGNRESGEANANFKEGQYSRERQNRDYLINRLMNTPVGKAKERQSLLDKLFAQFANAIEEGDKHTQRYIFDQLAGTAASRLEVKLDNTMLLEHFGRVLARHDGKVLNADAVMEELASELSESR